MTAVELVLVEIGGAPLPADVALLSADEHERMRRRGPRGAEFAIVRAALRRSAAARLERPPRDLVVQTGAGGRPEIDGCSLSISYARGLAVCALAPAGMAIGVDCEPADRAGSSDLEERLFSPRERVRLARYGEAARRTLTLRRWTAREAVAKACGWGLSAVLAAPVRPSLDLVALHIPGYVGTLAVDRRLSGGSRRSQLRPTCADD